jgi:hypothetical protein
LLREPPRNDERAQAALRNAASAVTTWVEGYIDCEALECFSFDGDWDPAVRPVTACSRQAEVPWACRCGALGMMRAMSHRVTAEGATDEPSTEADRGTPRPAA